jgi:hypothetical protein
MRRYLIWTVVLLLASFGLAQAQETSSGSLTGQVIDAQGAPVPGASVSVVSAQGTKTITADSNGRFFAPYLTPGRYSVKVELAGFATVEQRNIDVRLGQRLEVSGLVLKVGGITDTVEVVGTAPVVDVTSTTTGGVLDSDVIRRMPVGRNFTDTLYLVPGVSTSDVGRANPSIGGASGLDNNYVVDGVNITDTGYGAVGAYSQVFGSMGSGVTTDFIKETQVKTGGFEAEYGEATGGVVNVVTQSGTNAFHGSVYGFWRPTQLEGNRKELQTAQGTVNTTATTDYDFGATVGGPIVHDKIFFFGAFNPQFERTTLIAPRGFPLDNGASGYEQKRRILSYAGKLTWQASTNHRVDFTAFGDPSHGDNGPQRTSALLRPTTAGFSELKSYGGHNQSLKYEGILSRNWLIELSAAHAQNQINEIPSLDEPQTTDKTLTPSQVRGGIGFYSDSQGRNTQVALKSTNIFAAAGNHQVRYGASYQDIQYTEIRNYTGSTFTLPSGVQTATGPLLQVLPDPVYGQIYRATRGLIENRRETPQKYLAFFLQDTWQMGKHLSFRPGVRYEQQRLTGSQPLCHADDSSPGAGDGTGDLINCSIKFDKNWGPRLGATYDLSGNGKSKVYASYGRFYVKIPNDLAVRALSADTGISRADYFDAALTRPVPNGTLAVNTTSHFTTAGASASVFDPDQNNRKVTYQDEILGGLEFDIGRGINVGARYIHRNLGRVLEDASNVAVGWCDLYGSAVPGQPGLNACNTNYLIQDIGVNSPPVLSANGYPQASFEKPEHKYDSVEVTANKAFSNNWSLVASYRWSKLQGNFEGFFRSDNGQSDPSISSLFDFPSNDPGFTSVMAPRFGYQGDIRYQGCALGCGTLPNDRTHQVKLYGNRTWGALNVGLGFNAGSGKPLTGLYANPNYGNAGEIPDSERGSGIQTADGFKKRASGDLTVDLHADYTLKLNNTQRVAILADVFNLFDRQVALDYDTFHDRGAGIPNANFGLPLNGGGASTPGYQTPRAVRVGARFEW